MRTIDAIVAGCVARESPPHSLSGVARRPIYPPRGYRAFHNLLDATGVSREDEHGLPARAVRWGVTQGVRVLRHVRSLEFPSRGTGGWWWLWRWKFEFLMNWFEWQSLGWARRLIRPGMTVLDLGAHVGYYSRFLSRLVGAKGKVYAFEASPENQAVLRRNLDSPRYNNVEVVPSAISDHEGTMKLFVSPGHSNHSLIQGFTPADDVLEIPTVSVDGFAAQRGIPVIDFIKMDIEGAETMALNGMRETIRKSPQLALLAECNPLALRTAGTTPAEYMQLIEDIGLTPLAILDDASLGPLPDVASIEASISLYVNLLCVKPGDSRLAELEGLIA
jgi:FkbM family methyltransferase